MPNKEPTEEDLGTLPTPGLKVTFVGQESGNEYELEDGKLVPLAANDKEPTKEDSCCENPGVLYPLYYPCHCSCHKKQEPTKEWGDEILSRLRSRKGFYGWWDGIDDETQEDIETELSLVVQQALSAREEELVEKIHEKYCAGMPEDEVIALIKG